MRIAGPLETDICLYTPKKSCETSLSRPPDSLPDSREHENMAQGTARSFWTPRGLDFLVDSGHFAYLELRNGASEALRTSKGPTKSPFLFKRSSG